MDQSTVASRVSSHVRHYLTIATRYCCFYLADMLKVVYFVIIEFLIAQGYYRSIDKTS
jgi:hypothetical protein